MAILTTVLSVSLISGGLALIIVIAEYFLNNYGECQLDINKGDKQLTVKGGSSLLASLSEHKIYLPSACGGKATCGLCKVQVQDGAGPILPTEVPYLSKEEMEQGYRLSCQIKVKTNMALLIPEELFNIRAYQTTVEKMDTLTHDIKGVKLRLSNDEEINFKAGQYVQLHTKPYAKVKDSVFRAYSIASIPSARKQIELIVRLVPEGICTTFVHEHLSVGDNAMISGPYGDFYLRGNCSELVMIAGGSGLAPIRSIIFDVLEKGLDFKMNFFFGAVTKKDLYYMDEFAELAAQNENFIFIPALSGPGPEDEWEGETGLITEVVDRYVENPDGKEAYLCGSPGMVNACLNVLGKKGFDQDKIFYDKF